jgi:hypothetical protein
MSSIFGSQYRRPFLFICFLGLAQLISAQAVASDVAQKLVLVQVGNGKTAFGHDVSIRLYKATDGVTGRVEFVTLDSLQAAQEQIEDWIRLATAIKSREHYDDEGTHGFNDRILAEWRSPTHQGVTIVVIIRRDGLSCYHIESSSMQIAEQIEQMIDTAPNKVPSRP